MKTPLAVLTLRHLAASAFILALTMWLLAARSFQLGDAWISGMLGYGLAGLLIYLTIFVRIRMIRVADNGLEFEYLKGFEWIDRRSIIECVRIPVSAAFHVVPVASFPWLGRWGWAYVRRVGWVQTAVTDLSQAVLFRFSNRRPLLITPRDPQMLINWFSKEVQGV